MSTHAPPSQVSRAAHALPHAPQLASSATVSMQRSPQRMSSGPHTPTQRPAVQRVPAAQALAHAPQLVLSTRRSAQ
jgi:hypothetical protein